MLKIASKKIWYSPKFTSGMLSSLDNRAIGHNKAEIISGFCYDDGALRGGMGIERANFKGLASGDILETVDGSLHLPFQQMACIYPLKSASIRHKVFLIGFGYQDRNGVLLDLVDDPLCELVINNINRADLTKVKLLPYIFNGECVVLIGTKTDGLWMFKETGIGIEKIENVGNVRTLEKAGERIFAALYDDDHTLFFSDDYDPTNWRTSLDEGGFIKLDRELGDILHLECIGNYLYVFRSYGVTRLYIMGGQSDFYVNNVYQSSSPIYDNTFKRYADSVIFCTSRGLYLLRDNSVVSIGGNLDNYLQGADYSNACCEVEGDKYYLAMRKAEAPTDVNLKYSYNDTLIKLDLKTGDYEILENIDIASMCVVRKSNYSKLLLSTRSVRPLTMLSDKSTICGTAINKFYKSTEFDLKDNTVKHLERIRIYTRYEASITLKLDDREYTYRLKEGNNDIYVNKTFTVMNYTIKSTTEYAYILPPQFLIVRYYG